MPARQPVTFFSMDRLRLAGDLYWPSPPAAVGKTPGIVLCQGLSGIKEKVLPSVAEAFASAGYATLAFDYCGCGQSGNRRARPYVFPLERAQDAFAAVAYLKTLPGIDTARIGLYGISYGGGVALYCAALDPSVKTAVFVSSPAGGADFMASLRTRKAWHHLLDEIAEDRARRALGKASRLAPLQEVVPFPASFWQKYSQLDHGDESESLPGSPHRRSSDPHLSLESAEAMITFRPDCLAHLLHPRPVLFIHGEKDDVAHLTLIRRVYRRTRTPKRLAVFPGMDHIDLDRGEGLARQIQLSLSWFDDHLKRSARKRKG